MSKMAELDYEIQELYIEGHSPKAISAMLGCAIDMVYNWLESNNVEESPQEDFNPFDTVNS